MFASCSPLECPGVTLLNIEMGIQTSRTYFIKETDDVRIQSVDLFNQSSIFITREEVFTSFFSLSEGIK